MARKRHQGWRAERLAGRKGPQSVSPEEFAKLEAERLAREAAWRIVEKVVAAAQQKWLEQA